MSEFLSDFRAALLPDPKELSVRPGRCPVGPGLRIEFRAGDERLERATLEWRSSLARPRPGVDTQMAGRLVVCVDPRRLTHSQGYILEVDSGGIELVGGSAAGCYHGLQTLRQLSRVNARAVPCVSVRDWPDFSTRGVLCDVTRGKVPTLATLKAMTNRLAALKVNQLQLYVEHAFTFGFDPSICSPDDGLTPDEVAELDRHCRDRFIDLVPALATFGHMGRILSLPKYRHLADVEATESWDAMSWPKRARGFTLDCVNPESRRLVERMWTDVLDAFGGSIVNICGDEPWDLGRGKTRERVARFGRADVYLEHVEWTHDLCRARGRRTQLFGDVLCHEPSLLDGLSRDTTVFHWGYDDQTDYAGVADFVHAGLDTVVCPGTSGWKRVLNAMDAAERNMAMFATAGHRHGACGLVNTDWGDHGHFNLLASSWHGLTLGASVAWSATHPTDPPFDERFARVILGVDTSEGITRLRAASRLAESCETWRMLWAPLGEVASDPTLPSSEDLATASQESKAARRWLEGQLAEGKGDAVELTELAVACQFNEMVVEKMMFAHQLGTDTAILRQSRQGRRRWADRLTQLIDTYAICWRARNKESGLGDIQRALATSARDMTSEAAQ